MIWIFLILFSIPFIIWLAAFFFTHDFSLPTGKLPNNILVVFPHPDDEAMTCSGALAQSESTYLILTKGEKGTPEGKEDKQLKKIRAKEAEEMASILGTRLIHRDYGDGELNKKRAKLRAGIEQIIRKVRPQLIITYDKSGLYGHPDHVVVSEITTELAEKHKIRLWYVSFPKKALDMINLPEEMADDKNFRKKRKEPSLKIFAGYSVMKKIKTIYAHKSQLFAFRKGYPRPFPLWFYASLLWFEYFYEV